MQTAEFIPPYHDEKSFHSLKKTIEKSGFIGVRIISDSMEPLLLVDENVTIRWFGEYRQLKRFTPILFWDGQKLICHYVWHLSKKLDSRGRTTVLTRSLKNIEFNDVPVPVENILGIVTGKQISVWHKIRIIFYNILHSSA